MCGVDKSNILAATRRITNNFGFVIVIVILLFKLNYFELSESVKHSYDYSFNSGGNASTAMLRFNNFEPRNAVKNLKSPDLLANFPNMENLEDSNKRQGRGFHFAATGEDISVELEFIVPFYKIPVKRSVSLAKNALQGILNLQAGALVNAVVIVVAAGSIAILIKLLTTTLAVSTPPNIYGYGHGYKKAKSEEVVEGTTLVKSVRSLTSALENKLSERNINITACIQRVLCGYLRNQYEVDGGSNNFIMTLLSMQYTNSLIQDTAVHHAIESAKDPQGCDLTYHNCRWSLWNTKLLNTLKNYLKIYNG